MLNTKTGRAKARARQKALRHAWTSLVRVKACICMIFDSSEDRTASNPRLSISSTMSRIPRAARSYVICALPGVSETDTALTPGRARRPFSNAEVHLRRNVLVVAFIRRNARYLRSTGHAVDGQSDRFHGPCRLLWHDQWGSLEAKVLQKTKTDISSTRWTLSKKGTHLNLTSQLLWRPHSWIICDGRLFGSVGT